ncbi:MAG: hypothetical protein J6C46_11415 [Clostridia bacterium]|nr:hypothetical protein [Clostridia bacterium]
MNIRLNKISIRNFKGIKELDINFNGKNTNIYGDNATGKTSIFDAFLWALFNKNSAGKSDFSYKPFDKNGQEIHFLNTEVQLELSINGITKILKKASTENWVKKRGNAQQVYEGNVSSYWIDEVPVKLSEYQRMITDIIPEQKFKMITNPLFFNTQMSPDEQRTVISSIAEINNLTNEELMKQNEEFTWLCEKLNGHSVEDFIKIVKQTLKKLNDELEEIPSRIDEINRTMINVTDEEFSAANSTISACQIQKDLINKSINDVKERAKQNSETIQLLSIKENELQELKKLIYKEKNADVEKARVDLEIKINESENNIKILNNKKEMLERNISTRKTNIEQLRKNFDVENEKEFVDSNNYICPVCNREFENKDEMQNVAKEKFMSLKRKTLEEINIQGKALTDLVQADEKELVKISEEITKIENELPSLKIQAETLKDEEINYSEDDRYMILEQEIENLKEKVNAIVIEKTSDKEEKLQELENKIESSKTVIAKKDAQIKAEERIKELLENEKVLADKIQEQEKYREAVEEFSKYKINLLEEKINQNFEIVKFKLFEQQINGGMKEVCYATVDGVPFSDLNSAMKINAGLDIIKTLTNFYDVQAPIFIDNKETVNKLIDIETQLITLIVSSDEKLRMEVL